jgi:hypothetical protein
MDWVCGGGHARGWLSRVFSWPGGTLWRAEGMRGEPEVIRDEERYFGQESPSRRGGCTAFRAWVVGCVRGVARARVGCVRRAEYRNVCLAIGERPRGEMGVCGVTARRGEPHPARQDGVQVRTLAGEHGVPRVCRGEQAGQVLASLQRAQLARGWVGANRGEEDERGGHARRGRARK